jgi:hypothetical protein
MAFAAKTFNSGSATLSQKWRHIGAIKENGVFWYIEKVSLTVERFRAHR